ncbi:C1 family peptidase [Pedobacter sp. GR22-6]|uniref:C1 family peptidase n=1 Tax=Pedobacter sp. GR22-6 TaxID=3127957 RepID=UPI00307D2081
MHYTISNRTSLKVRSRFLLFIFILLVGELRAQQIYTGLRSMDASAYAGFPGNLPSTTADKLPSSVDLSSRMPPVGNQSPQNSCVAWAIAYAAHGYYAKTENPNWSYFTSSGGLNFGNLFSPSYVYNQINRSQDQGSNYEDALSLIKEQGVATMATMGYVNYLQSPSQNARNEAANYKIKSFRRLGQMMNPILDAKDQLAKGHPVIINARTDLTYFDRGFSQQRSSPHIWSSVGNIDGQMNHALLLVGYDDSVGAFKFINSWGTQWGDQGYGWISYNIYNSVVPQSWIIIPSSSNNTPVNTVVYSEKSSIDNTDRVNGLDLYLTSVNHMNSITHPQISFNDRFMRVTGKVSIPTNSGSNASVVIYYYLMNPDGSRGRAIRSLDRSMSLPNGNIISYTPQVSLNNTSIVNGDWFADIRYVAFDLPRGFNPPFSFQPIVYSIIAEPALLLDGYPIRKGQPFQFTITH